MPNVPCVLRHVHLECHVVRRRRSLARTVRRALSEAGADDGWCQHGLQNAVVVVRRVRTWQAGQHFFGTPVASVVGAVEENVVAARAFQQRDGGAPNAVGIVVGKRDSLGITQHTASGVHAVGSDFDVGGVDLQRQVVVNHFIWTSFARSPAHHVEVGVGVEGEGAVGVAVDGRRAGFTACEVLLVVPAVHGELVFDGAWIQGQGHRPNAVTFRI